MAADDLQYVERDGEAVPRQTHVQKVFLLPPNILIGTAGVGTHPKIGYESCTWIAAFIISQTGDAIHRPDQVAGALRVKMQETFNVLESMPDDMLWETYKPGDRVVTYFVAGYADSFRRPYFYEVWTEVNAKGDGLIYFAEQRTVRQLFWIGEDQFWTRAANGSGEEPYTSNRLGIYREIESKVPAGTIPASLRDAALSLATLIKLEAKFNDKKVGSNVAIAVIDRTTKKFTGLAL
ncbi:MAG TPA: hypothetical protein VGN17_25510 [Bryobacteraceae bacterium]|jgi:hypothetical protein